MGFLALDVAHGFDAFRDGWAAQIGAGFPLPTFSPVSTGDFRVRLRAVKVHDAVVMHGHSDRPIRTTGALDGNDDQVRVWVMRRGGWTFDDGRTVPAGGFLVRYVGRPAHFRMASGTVATLMVLPSAALRPLIGDRPVTGAADSAELRVLTAHARVLSETLPELTPAGSRAARNALVELVAGVLRRHVDGAEPALAPALARAAQGLADERLTDPELSPATLARSLNVSVRTLHRAFAAVGEPVGAYVRRRRLEQARLALESSGARPSVSEIAARWQFSDSSHFVRAFKQRFGVTPAEYARALLR
ncbi:transcriptional regulator [Virgisporangium aliadipatigenens]|uniref:Transcriptional regulator n=1 Tax=Virgisporangium aliadipatigenens TaxID=741659 RepID=A0A8J3YI84_9ACTN|nr:helix-turn-helix domain-containing protein [Virgisporangium aliadipatigenens]GIJ44897.1 transcriptional regulator [Virgisporangium aliadipatigenens]